MAVKFIVKYNCTTSTLQRLFHLLQKEKGEESPFNFSIKLINLRIMLFLFFLHTLLLIGMADVMPRFGQKL